MFTIYKITNTKNGLIYVGQTFRTLKSRIFDHFHDPWSALYKPMHDFGIESFKVEPLAYAETKEEALSLEASWIDLLSSTNPFIGYNRTNYNLRACKNKLKGDSNLMNKYNVEPLRTAAEIEEMKSALFDLGGSRDRFLFVFGINTGLRISDIISCSVGQIRAKAYTDIVEQKTGKIRRVHLLAIQPEIIEYTDTMADTAFLFPSRNGGHISRTQAYRILVRAGDWIGRSDIGTHTMRKTFGYHYYKKTHDIATLMEIFGHSAPSITKRYIGIRDDEIADSLRDFRL